MGRETTSGLLIVYGVANAPAAIRSAVANMRSALAAVQRMGSYLRVAARNLRDRFYRPDLAAWNQIPQVPPGMEPVVSDLLAAAIPDEVPVGPLPPAEPIPVRPDLVRFHQYAWARLAIEERLPVFNRWVETAMSPQAANSTTISLSGEMEGEVMKLVVSPTRSVRGNLLQSLEQQLIRGGVRDGLPWGERLLDPATRAFRNFHHGEGNALMELDGIRVIGATRPFETWPGASSSVLVAKQEQAPSKPRTSKWAPARGRHHRISVIGCQGCNGTGALRGGPGRPAGPGRGPFLLALLRRASDCTADRSCRGRGSRSSSSPRAESPACPRPPQPRGSA